MKINPVYFQRQIGVKMGLFQKDVISKAPISNVSITGEKTLKRGQLVSYYFKPCQVIPGILWKA